MCFLHETSDDTNDEIWYTEDQISALNKTEVPTNNDVLKIKHTVLLTMVDEKICKHDEKCCNRYSINNKMLYLRINTKRF